MRVLALISLVTLLALPNTQAQGLFINEISYATEVELPILGTISLSWVEIYNKNDGYASLDGYSLYLQSSRDTLELSGPIKGREFYLIANAISFDSRLYDTRILGMNALEDTLILFDPDYRVADMVRLKPHMVNHSNGRFIDGQRDWMVYETPTPGKSNNQEESFIGYAPQPQFKYVWAEDGIKHWAFSCDTPNTYLHYTTDSSEPSDESPLFEQPIPLSVAATAKARVYRIGYLPSQVMVKSFKK